jgi:hypothetical protein
MKLERKKRDLSLPNVNFSTTPSRNTQQPIRMNAQQAVRNTQQPVRNTQQPVRNTQSAVQLDDLDELLRNLGPPSSSPAQNNPPERQQNYDRQSKAPVRNAQPAR